MVSLGAGSQLEEPMRVRTRSLIGIAAAVALSVPIGVASAAHAGSLCPLPTFGPGPSYHPSIDPGNFGPEVDNPYFPLKPGSIHIYVGTKDNKKALNVFAPSAHTKTIDGVETRVVEDRLYLDNVLEERTVDYYAQDKCGNVWYFGEDTATLDAHGKVVSRDGSFHAGSHGAQPGVYMQAHPEVGREFRQEWSSGQAEDRFTALDLSTKIKVPAGSFDHALRTKEATDLEPDVLDNKYYVKGIGEVAELAVKGPPESLKLVEVIS